jgi:hypothetical protein
MTASPVFVATFDDKDKTTTRMSVWCGENGNKLDMARGVLLARHAYRQRTGREPVALAKAYFEKDGVTLQAYNAIELDGTQEKGGKGKTATTLNTDGGAHPGTEAAAVPHTSSTVKQGVSST